MARYQTVSAALSASEKREFIARCRASGHKRESSVARRVVLAWTRSARVRRAVLTYEAKQSRGLVIA